jgi:hypothetical protein
MNLRYFFQGIRNIITNPAEYWERLTKEKAASSSIRKSVLLPFALLIAISGFAGSIIFTDTHLYPVFSFLYGLQCLLEILIAVYLASAVLTMLSGPLEVSFSFSQIFMLIALSLVPFFVCQTISKLFESFQFVNIMALYGLNIFWIGSDHLLNLTGKKKVYLLITAFAAVAAIYFMSDLVLGLITDRIYFVFFA